MSDIEIDVWNGDWGLASVDCSCLQLLALLKFWNVDVKVNATNNPFKSPSGRLPVFKTKDTIATDYHEILTYLKNKNKKFEDSELENSSEIFAYEVMLLEKLHPALLYTWWIENKNYTSVIRPWYAKALPFPLNYYYPGHYKRMYTNKIYSVFPNLKNVKLEQELYKQAETCLECVNNRLGNNVFIFGDEPSSLDALLFGYLATLLKIPVQHKKLQDTLNNFPNLVKYTIRIMCRFFSQDLNDYDKKRQNESGLPTTDLAFPNKTRNQILAALFAIIAMTSYAFVNGIFSISFNNKEDYSQYDLEIDANSQEDEEQ